MDKAGIDPHAGLGKLVGQVVEVEVGLPTLVPDAGRQTMHSEPAERLAVIAQPDLRDDVARVREPVARIELEAVAKRPVIGRVEARLLLRRAR